MKDKLTMIRIKKSTRKKLKEEAAKKGITLQDLVEERLRGDVEYK